MKQSNQLIKGMVISLILIVTAFAEKKSEPSELTKLRSEYQDKAEAEITPVNERYLVLLKRMEKMFSRDTDTHNAMAVREEIERLEKNSALLLEPEVKDSVEMFEGKWIVTYNPQGVRRTLNIQSSGRVTATDSLFGDGRKWTDGGRTDCKIVYDEDTQVYIGVDGKFIESYDLKGDKLAIKRYTKNEYPNSPHSIAVGKRTE